MSRVFLACCTGAASSVLLGACSLTLDFAKFGTDAGVAPSDAGDLVDARSDGTAPPTDGMVMDGCEARAEECNGVDDDCDGMSDETFDLTSNAAHCGACGNPCPGAYACTEGVCDSTPTLLTAGATHACVVLANGEPWCWGNNTDLQLGALLPGTETSSFAPVRAGGLIVDAIDAGSGHTCAATRSRELYCWGNNGRRRTGLPPATTFALEPQPVTMVSDVFSIAAGEFHTCILRGPSRALRCAGNNANHQVGQMATTVDYAFGEPSTPPSSIETIASTSSYTCVVTSTGAVQCWGANSDGQLGPGAPTPSSPAPNTVAGITGATVVATGRLHACAVADGMARCWGRNVNGQVLPPSSMSPAPATPIPLAETIVGVSAGEVHSCALSDVGHVFCWGANNAGQLGIGMTGATAPPTMVVELPPARTIASGSSFTCAITRDDEVWCWGRNANQQLGVDDAVNHPAPVLVEGPWTRLAP